MSEMTQVEPQKTAGFVDRGFNHSKRKAQIEDEEKEIARLEAIQRGEEEPDEEQAAKPEDQQEKVQAKGEPEEDDSKLAPEERTFKKRYGDLRRHMETKEKEWDDKFESLKSTAERKGIVPPKSDEDIEKWAKEYPDVAGIVETIAAKKAKELFDKADARLQKIDEAEADAYRLKSENAIREAHPDFDDLRNGDPFHDWAEAQPKRVKDALYENMDDPDSVIRVIDLYKIDNGHTAQAKKANTRAAAKPIGRGSRTKVDPTEGGATIRESDVSKMSSKEFEAREEEIAKAMRTGKFVYDLSGSAR